MDNIHLDYHTTQEPTYWSTHENRRPDLLDFFISKGIAREKFTISSCMDLTSDHSVIFGLLSSMCVLNERPLRYIAEQIGMSFI